MFALTTPCFNAARSSAGAAAAHLGATPEPCSALSSRDCGGSRLLVVARWRARRVRVAASTRAGPETETEGSPLDFPEEWMKATPSRRPDIFPEFKPLKPQLPQPMPGDPEVPNDEEEADEKRQKPGEPPDKKPKEDDPDDPDKEQPDKEKEKPETPAPE